MSSWSGKIVPYKYWTPRMLITLFLMSDAVNVVKNHVASCEKVYSNKLKKLFLYITNAPAIRKAYVSHFFTTSSKLHDQLCLRLKI